MRQLIIKANGCHDCLLTGYNGVQQEYKCKYILADKYISVTVSENVKTQTFHKDCPMVEVNND